MNRTLALSKTLFVFVPLSIACIVVVTKTMGPRYWWFGFLLAKSLQAYFHTAVFRGQSAIMRLGKERIAINLHALGKGPLPRIFKFQWRYGIILAFIAMVFMATISNDVERGFNEIARILKPEELILRIEYPAWVEATPAEKKFGDSPIEFQADAASYLELKIRNYKTERWNVSIRATKEKENSTQGLPHSVSLGNNGAQRWGQSLAHLLDLLGSDKTKTNNILVDVTDSSGSISKARIRVAPITEPHVSLAPQPESSVSSSNSLPFTINVQSRIPLSTISLEARTKSGYRFSKTVAEHAGSDQLYIKDQSALLPTIGIPFAAQDILYVKAVAKTIVNGIDGSSAEIEIPVKSREEIRKQLKERLESVLKTFDQSKDSVETLKNSVQKELAESASLANALGRHSFARKKIGEAMPFVDRIKSKQDSNSKAITSRIKTVLDSLKRTESQQEVASLFSRLQNLRNNIQKLPADILPTLSKEASQIADTAEELHKKLASTIQSSSSGLSADEKSAAQRLLSTDTTAEKIKDIVQPLEKKQMQNADTKTAAALDESQRKLGNVVQLLMAARQRAMKLARENLQEADSQLQSARSKTGTAAEHSIQNGQDRLQKVPKLGQEFNQATSEAQNATGLAKESAHNNNLSKMMEGLDSAQDGIAKAIEALMDEEQQERDEQRDADNMEQRSAQELITTQGEVDAGWRKRILEEIARLRGEGEPADSSVLKFLESRLR